MLTFRAPAEIGAALDQASFDDAEQRSRSELIRSIITAWLIEHGYLPKLE
jgi:hypothetical protein